MSIGTWILLLFSFVAGLGSTAIVVIETRRGTRPYIIVGTLLGVVIWVCMVVMISVTKP